MLWEFKQLIENQRTQPRAGISVRKVLNGLPHMGTWCGGQGCSHWVPPLPPAPRQEAFRKCEVVRSHSEGGAIL